MLQLICTYSETTSCFSTHVKFQISSNPSGFYISAFLLFKCRKKDPKSTWRIGLIRERKMSKFAKTIILYYLLRVYINFLDIRHVSVGHSHNTNTITILMFWPSSPLHACILFYGSPPSCIHTFPVYPPPTILQSFPEFLNKTVQVRVTKTTMVCMFSFS